MEFLVAITDGSTEYSWFGKCHTHSLAQAEAAASLTIARLAMDMNWSSIPFFSDARDIVNSIKNKKEEERNRGCHGIIVPLCLTFGILLLFLMSRIVNGFLDM